MNKQLTGTVISTKMDKTVVVRVERKLRHPLYRKVIMMYKKYKAHYEGNALTEGDSVTIIETRPISKDKHFMVVESSVKGESRPAKEESKVEKTQVQEAQATVKAPKAATQKKTAAKKTVKKVTKAKK